MSNQDDFGAERLTERSKKHRLRSIRIWNPAEAAECKDPEGEPYIDFSSNDYLGLACHPEVIKKSQEYLQKYGAGSGASRLITGTYDIHTGLEELIADMFGQEGALLFNSGFQANSSILNTITGRHSLLLVDRLSHNSLLQGALSSRAKFQRFRHNDVEHLRSLLQKAQDKRYQNIWVITESIFSMDGDRSPLADISDLANEFNAHLFIDDAHAVGVWGEKGLGLAKNRYHADIVLGTCGKALGSFGAFVVCSSTMKNYLINFCPGFIYTTSLPPAVIGATEAALEIIPDLQKDRERYYQNITYFRQAVQKAGFDTGPSTTQIIPLIVGDDKKTLQLAEWLRKRGIMATAIRPPTVPEESSRIRLTLSSRHSKQHLDKLIKALKNWKHATG